MSSFVDPEEEKRKMEEAARQKTAVVAKAPKSPADSEKYPLFRKMDAIIASIDEQTKAFKELAESLNGVMCQMCRIADTLGAPTGRVTPPPTETPKATATTPTTGEKTSSFLTKTEEAFPRNLRDLLFFEVKGDYVMIKPRQYLGSENFAKIATIVREISGEYISAGKESHFRVPVPK